MAAKNEDNLLFLSDSYKITHWGMYPENMQVVYSYFESRTGAKYNRLVFFGLQHILEKYLAGPVITGEKLAQALPYLERHLYPGAVNENGFRYLIRRHGGRLPLKIRTVAEGSAVDVSNVMMTVENTDPNVPWLTNFVESLLLHVWYASTVATTSCEIKQMFWTYSEWTCDDDAHIDFQLHDFGFRSAASVEAAALAGAAHLLSFKKGTGYAGRSVFSASMV
ncbi:MAG: nicotinamide phosphoribosyltransferase domain-containing protein [Victivallaceae bacterium]|nr:nicotinamide phosphoribosyltransferase domain-containing protein [Victivallaceae bacterium]